jgi:DNA polymerase I
MIQLANNGCLFDIHHIKDRMVLWLKEANATVKRLEYPWSPSIYVASNSKSALKSVIESKLVLPFVKEYKFENRFENPSDSHTQEVLRLYANDSSKLLSLAKNIERLSKSFDYYRIYNVDISPEQSFLYEKDIHPLGFYHVKGNPGEGGEEKGGKGGETDDNIGSISLKLADSNDPISFDYVLPNFKFLSFELIFEKKTGKIITNFNDKIIAISVKVFDKGNNAKDSFLISDETELETILAFSYEVNRLDPDIILTSGGDKFLFPCLLQRAKANDIASQLLINLNRESDQEFLQKKNRMLLQKTGSKESSGDLSSSYTSYGKAYFKPRPFFLYGRIHIDTETSFIYKETGLDGLSEISRICMISPQIASRATIGKCLSSLYFYNAKKKGILVPWKPSTSEVFKTFGDLLKADKGGFVFESKSGAYDNVAEFDFVSLYPNIMLKNNISSETINCDCCDKFDLGNQVPGLERLYHICKKRTGLVPLSLKTVLDRRLEYKKRKNRCKDSSDKNLKQCYDKRQAALKWILVTSFGYLGFSNSKFGRIDAHIAVCAFARYILLETSRIAESNGFEVIHGIVDSIWVRKSDKCYKDMEKYRESCESLRKEIESQTGFSISFEGIYKWIVFDSSKTDPNLPALNRYFGVFEDGAIKARGIETRRHDIPSLFERFQNELLEKMSAANNIREVKELLPKLEEDIYTKYKKQVASKKVHYSDLAYTKRISKNSDGYSNRNTLENCAIQLLSENGKTLRAGEEIKYVIMDFYNKKHPRRSVPAELIDNSSFPVEFGYDKKRYCELLYYIHESITSHFY